MRGALLATAGVLAVAVLSGCGGTVAVVTAEAEWGPPKGGFATRLAPLEERYVLGRPMRFRLEMKNGSSSRMLFDAQQVDCNWSMIVTGPDGKRAAYIAPGYQTVGFDRAIDPGEVVVLLRGLDIASQYYVGRPGRYRVQYDGRSVSISEHPEGSQFVDGMLVFSDTKRGDRGPSRHVSNIPSNVVEIEVLPGELPPYLVAVGKLLEVLPGRWTISGARGAEELTPPKRDLSIRTAIRLSARDGKVGTVITVWETGRTVDLTSLDLAEYAVPNEYWGRNDRGHIYVWMPPRAEYLWAEARRKLAATLDVAGTTPPTPEPVTRVIELREALKAGDAREVEALVKAHREIVNADLHTHRMKGIWLGGTPLHWAVQVGDVAVAETLLNHGADINAVYSWYRSTPLHYAARLNRKDLLTLLLDRGADVNAKDRVGKTPLFEAAGKGHAGTVTILLDRGANINEKVENIGNRTPLHSAASGGHVEVVKILLDRGADLKAVTRYYGRTPLHIAASGGHIGIVKLLLAGGADTGAKDKKGRTPLKLAEEKGRKEVAELLRRHGSKD